MINDIFNILLPQVCLVFFIIIQLVLAMFVSPRFYKLSRLISAVGISLAIILLPFVQVEPQYFGFSGSVMSDEYTLLFDFIILICGFFITLITGNLLKTIKRNAYTFHAILLCAIFGAMNVVGANDFITLLVSMEILSFSTYFLIASPKGYYSKEACFKYLLTSAVSTGVFLFGVSYLYGITGSLNLSEIYEIIITKEPSLMYAVSGIIIICALAQKLAVFPFANWIIDVYKGAETSVLAFLATVPKLAMFGIICRLLVFALGASFEITFAAAFLALITALWANTYAVRENNVKVILACSASSNSSYAFLTAGLVSVYNLSTVLFYLICYVIMNISVFTFLNIYGDKNSIDTQSFKGIFRSNRALTSAYAISVIGLAGIPVTSGFVSKIYLFTAIVNSGLIFIPFLLALLMLMVIALFYYLKILLPLFEEGEKDAPLLKCGFSQKFVLIVTALITLIIGIYPEKLIELCRIVAYNI